MADMQTATAAQGKIVQCIGAVVDVEFSRDHMPRVYDALKMPGSELTLTGIRTNGLFFLNFPEQWTQGSPWADVRVPEPEPAPPPAVEPQVPYIPPSTSATGGDGAQTGILAYLERLFRRR